MLGIKVVGADGKPLTGGKAVLRYIGYLVSGIIAAFGFLWVALDPKRQGLHDKFAGSYVVYMDDHFTDASATEFVPADHRPGWIWIALWVVLAISMPLALVVTLLAVGPYLGALLISLLGGGKTSVTKRPIECCR